MTCNLKWTDVVKNLLLCQIAANRPDVCKRVFNLKKDYLVDLVRQKLFGEVMAYVYTVEFQKRGLPHFHMLVTPKQNSKITNPNTVGQFVSAEILDPNVNKKLQEMVMKHMNHGPCADWCKVKGKCSKRFPKSFQQETTMDKSGYPQYHQRDTGILYEKKGSFVVDYRNAVPYSPTLSTVLNCHVNVEVVSSINAVMYIYTSTFMK
ncbi:uncharacterized protein LOC117169767 [Belonocnema kinseyi]|uniref:uncharacterized protein LOC117169767 n=1 Tax=Belonocnema kinseyi TaxID=2817044 RepID=UPI00143D0A25|nr:uncharacterized protein LOC117169767 [Belonocnema kinseyi]